MDKVRKVHSVYRTLCYGYYRLYSCYYLDFWLSCGCQQALHAWLYLVKPVAGERTPRFTHLLSCTIRNFVHPFFNLNCSHRLSAHWIWTLSWLRFLPRHHCWHGDRDNLSERAPRRSDWGSPCSGLAGCDDPPHRYSNLMKTTSHQTTLQTNVMCPLAGSLNYHK